MASLSQYFHTLRYLRPVQFWSRAQMRLVRPQPDLRPAPAVRPRGDRWQPPVTRPPCMTGPRQFEFLNVPWQLPAAGGWSDADESAGVDRLWLYNLHYFDDLAADAAADRAAWHAALIDDWLDRNPPAIGPGWEPYPLSRRVVNWIKWADGGGQLSSRAAHSLAVQLRYLTRRLEYHLLGNHLLANAKALVVGGLFFDGDEARGWLERGLAIFAQQLPEQILADGGHYERSTMYHALVLEDLLDTYAALSAHRESLPPAGAQALATWPKLFAQMRRWLAALTHPDGEIAFFNDAAFGIAAAPATLETYAQRLGMPACEKPSAGITHLAESGYIRVEAGPAVALLDVAPLGPDFLPGHAHADTLSFELSLFGQRLIVNGGTSTYREGAQRERERSTAAHNTVEIDGQSSSEMWGAFRVARRARPQVLEVRPHEGGAVVRANHDGYRRLHRDAVVERQWTVLPHSLRVSDQLGRYFDRAVCRFHLHPDVKISGPVATDGLAPDSPTNREEYLLRVAGRPVRWGGLHGVALVADSDYHPRFGVSTPTKCLVWRPNRESTGSWFDWDYV